MRFRKGIKISKATEEELLRWQMERIVRVSAVVDDEFLGEYSEALAKLYNSLKHRHAGLFLGILMSLYSIVYILVLIVKIFRRK